MPRPKTKSVFTNIAFYVVAILFSIFFFFPIWQNIVGGFSTIDSLQSGKSLLFPQPLSWNWPDLASLNINPTVWRFLFNTIIIALSAVPAIFFSALTSFGLTRFKVPGQNIVFFTILSTIMLPFTVTMIPRFIMFKNFGWINTYLPFYVPTISGNAMAIFLLRQFMKTIPKDIDEAAKIDGAGYFRIFWQIILPLSAPALITTFIFTLVGIWNDFMTPLLYLNSTKMFPISLSVMILKALQDRIIPWNSIMLEALLATVPMVIIYFILQKHIVQGVVASGIKG